jgi:hypothetical protein
LTNEAAGELGQLGDLDYVLVLMNGTLWSTDREGKSTLATRLARCLESSLCKKPGLLADRSDTITIKDGRLKVSTSAAEGMTRSVVAVLPRPTLSKIRSKWKKSGFEELDGFVCRETDQGTELHALRGRAFVPTRPVHINNGLDLKRRSVYAGKDTAKVAFRAIMGEEAQGTVTFVTLTQGAAMYKLLRFGIDATKVDLRSYPTAAAGTRRLNGRNGASWARGRR